MTIETATCWGSANLKPTGLKDFVKNDFKNGNTIIMYLFCKIFYLSLYIQNK